MDIEPRDFTIKVDGDLAFCHGFFQLNTTTQQDEHVAFWMRATVCLERANGEWKIVHEHTSVPFSMDGSFVAVLDLKP